jgi:beta-glucosidase
MILGSIGCGAALGQAVNAPAWRQISHAAAEKMADRLLAQMTPQEKQLQLLAFCPNGLARLGIPNLAAGEALHGAMSDGCTCFPMAIAMGSMWDTKLMQQLGTVAAAEARAVGIEQGFAPMLGLARDPRWGRVEESYGEDPYLVAQLGTFYIEGLQGMGAERFGPDHIIATPKHFVADGEPWAGANGEDFEISERVLREIYLPPFESAIRVAHAGSIMPAHHAINGVPCHVNTWLLDEVLRKEWGFQGFATSDMGDVPKVFEGHRYAHDLEEAAIDTLTAGVDMELAGDLYKGPLSDAIAHGRLPMSVLNTAAKRVLSEKIELLGLLPVSESQRSSAPVSFGSQSEGNHAAAEAHWAQLIAQGNASIPENIRRSNADQVLHDPAHDALALKAAEEAIVLLKNDGKLLPLDREKYKHILVAGPLGIAANLGGYSTGRPKFCVNIVDGIKAVAGPGVNVDYALGCKLEDDSDSDLQPAMAQAQSADVIIAVVGFTRGQAGENLDRDNLNLIGGQERMVETLASTGKPLVVLLQNGAPLTINWIHDHIPAIVETWYGGQSEGTAAGKVVFGEVNPSGKLNVSFPRSIGQIPCYYNHLPITGPINYYHSEGGVLYPFGLGLSYTTFDYSHLEVTPGRISGKQLATVRATIRNSGSVAGDEVVQFYIRQDFTSLLRPVLELKGFERISLKPGESRTVAFPVGFEQLKFWKDGKWVMEPGTIQIKVGSSSVDLPLQGRLDVTAG